LAGGFDKKVEIVHAADEVIDEDEFEDTDEELVERPPVVTIMGHVDHGKTSLLAAIRETEVAAGEAGGIPQHVGADQVHPEGLTPADWGGDTEFSDVSAKTRQGLDELLENIVTLSELQELRSNPNTEASGTVIESRLDRGRGPVVSILVQRGTLHVGDALVAGAHWGRVRAMHDYRGERVKEAQPGEPVEVLGFDGVPEAGEHVRVVENERRARQLAADRANRLKTEALARRAGVKVSLEDVFARAQEGDLQELNLIVKADVAGSLEALADEIAKLPQQQVTVNIIHDGVGGINESDVMLAAASDAVIIGFSVRPVGDAARVA